MLITLLKLVVNHTNEPASLTTIIISLDMRQKMSHSAAAGSYVQQGQYYPTQGGMVAPNAMLPVHPMYHYHHQSQSMTGLHAHFFPPATTTSGAIANTPAIVSKPAAAMPTTTGNFVRVSDPIIRISMSFVLISLHIDVRTVCMAVEQVTGCS